MKGKFSMTSSVSGPGISSNTPPPTPPIAANDSVPEIPVHQGTGSFALEESTAIGRSRGERLVAQLNLSSATELDADENSDIKPLIPGIEHLPGLFEELAGHGFEAVTSKNNADFIRLHIRPMCKELEVDRATFCAGSRKVLYLANGKDINAFSRPGCIDHMTQNGKGSLKDGAFGDAGVLFTARNIIQTDRYSKESQDPRKPYRQASSAITATTGSTKTTTTFYKSMMNPIIDAHLQKASASSDGVSLSEFTHELTMDLGASLMMEANSFRPSDIIRDDPAALPLFSQLSLRLSENRESLLQYMFQRLGFGQVDLEAERKNLIAYTSKIVEKNYAAISRNPKSSLRLKWETDAFFGKGKNSKLPFPETWEEFQQILAQEEYRVDCEDLLIDQAFLQLVTSETTAQAMSFALLRLLKDPELVQALRKELEGVDLDDITSKSMSELPLLSGVVLELLRLYLPAPLINWEPKENLEVTLGGETFTIPEDFLIIFDNEMANQLAYKNGDEFHPERWKEEGDFHDILQNLSKGSDTLRTFAGGARVCPGRVVAAMEIAKLIAFEVMKYNISTIPPNSEISMARSGPTTLRPDHDYRVSFEARQ